MLGLSFARARRYARHYSTALAAVYSACLATGLGLVALIWALGLLTHVAIGSRPGLAPADAVAGGPPAAEPRAPLGWGLVAWWLPEPADATPSAILALDRRRLLAVLALGLAAALAYCLAGYGHERAVAWTVELTAARLRRDLARRALDLGSDDLMPRHQASLAELFHGQVDTIREGLAAWWQAIPAAVVQLPLLILCGLAIQFWTALAGLLIVCLDWIALHWWFRRMRHRQSLLADRAQGQLAALDDCLVQSRLVASLRLADVPGQSLDNRLLRWRATAVAERSAEAGFRLALRLAVLATTLVLLALIGLNVLSSPPRCSLAEAAMLTAILISSYQPVTGWLLQRGPARRADRAARAVFGFLDGPSGVVESSGGHKLRPLVEQLELQGVTVVDRAGRRLLEEVSVRLPAKGRVAVLATDDASLAALAGLLARLFDPTSGRVLIDGRDLRQVSLESVRGQVGLALQAGLLFSGSVAENLACGGTYSTQEITDATRQAGVYALIQRMPQGLATTIGRDGLRLDPNEALQLGLARLLLRDPRVVVLEEPATEPETKLGETLESVQARWAAQRLLIVLARRLATLRHADRVLLLHEGRLVAGGTHAELLKSSDLYRHLHYVRFNEFRNLNH